MQIPKKPARLFLNLCLAACFATPCPAFAATNLIVNGGFETGDFTGWSQTGDSQYVGVTNFYSNSGEYSAYLGALHSGSISQSFNTIPGLGYYITFSVTGPNGPQTSPFPQDLFVEWDNNPIYDVTWVENIFPNFDTLTAYATASSATSTLSFNYDHEVWTYWIDDVSVVGLPEPSTWAMMLLGFGAIGFAMRRKRIAQPINQLTA